MAAIDAIFLVSKILQSTNLVQVVFDLLDDSWSAVFAQVVHSIKSLENASPLLGLGLDLGPEVLHDDGVVLPVVGVVGQHLQLAIRDVPVLVRGRLV